MSTQPIHYPYLPEGREFRYVEASNPFMEAAKQIARKQSLDENMPNGSVIVKNGEIIGRGANGSNYHKEHGCERVRRNIPTGQDYELCEGCHPKNHSEPKAIADAQKAGMPDLSGADIYLWGHWWCCEACWKTMINAGIQNIYLLKDSEILFNKDNPNNIIGKQLSE